MWLAYDNPEAGLNKGPDGRWRNTHVEIAGIQKGRVFVVRVPEVPESDVVDITITDIRPGPGLQARAVLPVQQPDILNYYIPGVCQSPAAEAEVMHPGASQNIKNAVS